jgi:hypothetical protein
MSSVPPGFSPLRLPLGEIVFYPTGRPSIRSLPREIAALGYEVSGFPLPHTDLRPLPPGVGHWAVVLGNIILLLPLPRRRRRRIRLQTRAATALPPTTSPTRITGAPSSWRCTEGCDERRSTVKNRVNQRSSDGMLRYVLLLEQAPGSRARDKIKIRDPGGGATGG